MSKRCEPMLSDLIRKYSIDSIKFYRSWRSCLGYKPVHIEWLVSSRCNLRCKMCNVWKLVSDGTLTAQSELSYSQGSEFLEEISALGTKLLTLSGGEPMLRKDIFDLIRKAKKEELAVEMITNGTLITKISAEKLVESGLDSIAFSVDSSEPGPHDAIRGVEGSWKKAIEGMRHISYAKREHKNRKLKVSLFVIVTATNYHLIDKIVALKLKLGFDEIQFLPPIPKTTSSQDMLLTKDILKDLQTNYLPSIKEIMENLGLSLSSFSTLTSLCRDKESTLAGKYALPKRRKILCFGPWQMAIVDPFGNVYPCCHACTFQNLSEDMTHGFWGTEDFNMGNLRINTFREIWNSEGFKKFRNKCKSRPLPFSMCVYCNYSHRYDLFLTALFKNRKLLPKFVYSFLSHS